MKNKLAILALAGVGLIAATAPQGQPPLPMETAVEFCKVAHQKFMNGDKGAFLQAGMERLSTPNKNLSAAVCIGYGYGYAEGRKVHGT